MLGDVAAAAAVLVAWDVASSWGMLFSPSCSVRLQLIVVFFCARGGLGVVAAGALWWCLGR
eukprot:15348215-Ditylum_brightwellii.AAC.1